MNTRREDLIEKLSDEMDRTNAVEFVDEVIKEALISDMLARRASHTCRFPGCIATAHDGRDHCTIHYPENVAHRAVTIVTTHLWPLISRKMPWVRDDKDEGFRKRIATIRDEINDAIRRTT